LELIRASLPRAMECEAAATTAQLFGCLADAYMGLAGALSRKSTRQLEYMAKAVAAVEKAFDYYSAVEDSEYQCEMMAKKATIMKLSGETTRAADYAAAYVSLRRNAESLRIGTA
jgi:anaphase-promoting complex subunit 5